MIGTFIKAEMPQTEQWKNNNKALVAPTLTCVTGPCLLQAHSALPPAQLAAREMPFCLHQAQMDRPMIMLIIRLYLEITLIRIK